MILARGNLQLVDDDDDDDDDDDTCERYLAPESASRAKFIFVIRRGCSPRYVISVSPRADRDPHRSDSSSGEYSRDRFAPRVQIVPSLDHCAHSLAHYARCWRESYSATRATPKFVKQRHRGRRVIRINREMVQRVTPRAFAIRRAVRFIENTW